MRDKRIRICFLIRSLNRGGSERQLLELLRILDPREFQVFLVTYYSKNELNDELSSYKHVTHLSLKKRLPWWSPFFMFKLIYFIWMIRPHILHGYLATSNIVAIVAKIFYPFMKVVWGIRASNIDLDRFGKLAKFMWNLECRLSFFPNLTIANSIAGREQAIKSGFPADRTIFIPNGIDTVRFRPDPEGRKLLRSKWGVCEKEILIGYPARIHPMKDHSTFIQAIRIFLDRGNLAKFFAFGGGTVNDKAPLEKLSRELKIESHLTWYGTYENTGAVYSSMDISTLTSLTEGFPNTVAESMACGVPCVVTDVGDARLIVGEIGVAVNPKDAEGIAKGWEEILQRIQIGENCGLKARERIIKNFSLTLLKERTTNVFKALEGKKDWQPSPVAT